MNNYSSGGFQPGMSGPISLGTTIVSVTYSGGVMLAADSRTSNGNYVANRVQDKITPLADNVYLLRSGSAADTQAIARYVQYFIAQHQAEKGDEVEVETVANLAGQLAYNNKSNLQAGLIIAGYDKTHGASTFAIPLGGTLLKVPFAIGGSGSAYISGFVDRHFKPNMTREQCKDFITKAVGHAMSRDGSSGGCIRIVSIEESGVKREFVEGNKVPGDVKAPIPFA